ncbi:MAG: hypothetical protein R6U29_13175 [Desulfosudaceae bacterium]
MKPDQLYHMIKTTAEKIGITVKEHNLRNRGIPVSSGLCRIGQERFFIMDKRLPVREKVDILAECLANQPLDDIYVMPAVRERLKKYQPSSSHETSPEE